MSQQTKHSKNDIILFISLLLMTLLGAIALFFRGLAPEAGYPYAIPLLVLSSVHPFLFILDRFMPSSSKLGLQEKERNVIFYVALGSFLVALLLSILSETGSLGDALKPYGPMFAFLSGLPSTFAHLIFALEKSLVSQGVPVMKKGILLLESLLLITMDILGVVFVALGKAPYGFFLIGNALFALRFPLNTLD